MYAVTLLRNSTKECLDLICFVHSYEEFEEVIDGIIGRFGADYIGSHDLGFGFELAF